jgi:membrane-bound metal-dependent hydrolase YbcI (DUF457 family)
MLGRDHALSGAVAAAALAPALHVGGPYLAAAVALGAGAAVLPDIDHPDSSVSRTFGFATRAFAWLTDRLTGGHRHGTHSILGTAVFTAGAAAAGALQHAAPHGVLSWQALPAVLYLTLLYSAALRALRIGGHHGDLAGTAAAVVTCQTGADLTVLTPWHLPLLAVVTGIGCAAHIAGDEITHGGCPLFWPVSMHEFHLLPRPLRITTAKAAESWIVFPLLALGLAAVLARDAVLLAHLTVPHLAAR